MPGREGKTKDFLAQLPAESRMCRDVVHLASEAHVHGHSWADHILTEDSSWKEVGGQKRKGNPEVGIPGASPLAHPGNSSHVKSFHLPTPPNGVSPHGKQQWESLRELPNVSDPAEG